MTADGSPASVVAYLRELEVAARDLPQALRLDLRARTVRTLVDRVGDQPGEAAMAEALAELGEPADLVAAERGRYRLEPDPLRPRDVAAVYLLASGPFLVGLGVLAGLVLLLSSGRWPARQRVVATALFVVGAAVPPAVALVVPALPPLLALMLGALVVGPWSATVYLASLRVGRRIRAAKHVERQGLE